MHPASVLMVASSVKLQFGIDIQQRSVDREGELSPRCRVVGDSLRFIGDELENDQSKHGHKVL